MQTFNPYGIENNFLCCRLCSAFAATEMRLLRSAVSAFFDLVTLATRTVERFGGSLGDRTAEAPAE